MRQIEAGLDERRGDARDRFVRAEEDLVQVRDHLEGLAHDEHDGDGDQHDAELVLLSLLLETSDLVGLGSVVTLDQDVWRAVGSTPWPPMSDTAENGKVNTGCSSLHADYRAGFSSNFKIDR